MDTATATPIQIDGTVRLEAKTTTGYGNKADVFFLVASNIQEAVLIAWHDLIDLGVIGRDFPVASIDTSLTKASCRMIKAKASLDSIIGLPWAKKIVDDIVCWGSSYTELWPRLRTILDRCRHWNITVSKSKFEVGEKIFFAGWVITKDGIYPDPAKTAAIRDFPRPQNPTDIKSFLGLAQQLGHYHPDLAHLTAALRAMLKDDVAWVWTPAQEESFVKTKAALVSSTVLKP